MVTRARGKAAMARIHTIVTVKISSTSVRPAWLLRLRIADFVFLIPHKTVSSNHLNIAI
jgi:hypothetical protein